MASDGTWTRNDDWAADCRISGGVSGQPQPSAKAGKRGVK